MSAAADRQGRSYRLWIDGAFVAAASGELLPVADRRGRTCGQVAAAGVADLRSAVSAARAAAEAWGNCAAAQRGRTLYRLAEAVEADAEALASTLAESVPGGLRRARGEVVASVERLLSFAGWCDKFAMLLGGRAPVAAPFHVEVTPEPCGVVGVVAPDTEPLLALVSLIAPPLAAGCTVVALASAAHPAAAARFAEACAPVDLPHGVCNLLTGPRGALLAEFAGHRGIDALHAAGCTSAEQQMLENGASGNLKRVAVRALEDADWYAAEQCASPWWIEPFLQTKTLWHPAAG